MFVEKKNANYGDAFSDEDNVLTIERITPYLINKNFAEKLHIYKTVDSTNKIAKEMILEGAQHGTVIIADMQTAGKGRYGKNFYSPPQSGLYVSFILHCGLLNLPPVLITPAAAVTACKAVKSVCGKDVKIKWLNDILLQDKKICGILTEAVANSKSGCVEWLIVGIGINVYTEVFPDDLRQIAGSIYTNGISEREHIRNRLAAEIINKLLTLNGWLDEKALHFEYKKNLSMLGRAVTVSFPNETYDAVAVDVDEKCRLIVKKLNGETVALSSGEVSVKSKNNN